MLQYRGPGSPRKQSHSHLAAVLQQQIKLLEINIICYVCRGNALSADNTEVYFAIRVDSQEEPVSVVKTGHKEHIFVDSKARNMLYQSSSELYSSCENKNEKIILIFSNS